MQRRNRVFKGQVNQLFTFMAYHHSLFLLNVKRKACYYICDLYLGTFFKDGNKLSLCYNLNTLNHFNDEKEVYKLFKKFLLYNSDRLEYLETRRGKSFVVGKRKRNCPGKQLELPHSSQYSINELQRRYIRYYEDLLMQFILREIGSAVSRIM